MILWRGKSVSCDSPNRSQIRYRKVIVLTTKSISLQTEILSQAGHWRLYGHFDYELFLNFRKLQFGFEHIWYDGPNCSFAFGFLVFNWHNWECETCFKNR